MEKKHKIRKIHKQKLMKIKVCCVLLFGFAVLLALLILLQPRKENLRNNVIVTTNYFQHQKPYGWLLHTTPSGMVMIDNPDSHDGNTNINGLIAVKVDISPRNRYAPMDLNPVFVRNMAKQVLNYAGVPIEDLDLHKVWKEAFIGIFSCINYEFNVNGYNGYGMFFYSRDAAYNYVAIWQPDEPHIGNTARNHQTFVRLIPPFDQPVFVRPYVDTRRPINIIALQRKARTHLKNGMNFWENRTNDAGNTLSAIRELQRGFSCYAMAGAEDIELCEKASRIYEECMRFRTLEINRLKGNIVKFIKQEDRQQAALNAERLASYAVLETEANVKEWAGQQYIELSKKKIK
ncbi:hypothetical protein P0136_10405 [Lentisphaerota bacterium ZTH]|nr:hypothetical protein JYG24_12085 [Lentisphaerota bacterium]WET05772.1 hypothetical protein P0136_10405 [Lentisphaerota bacterium ZTH]